MTNLAVGLDVSILTEVLETGSKDARMVLARQLAGLLADPDSADIEKQQVIPVILKLTVDEDIEVRTVLAEELASIVDLPADILFAVVADAEEVALPFLAHAMCLNTSHMLAILRVGDAARQTVIAQRPDVTSDVAAYIIKHGAPEACKALMAHPAVQFHGDDYRTVYGRHGSLPAMTQTLLDIAELPGDLRIVETRRTAARLRQFLLDKGWIPANEALEMISDTEESTVLRVLSEAGEKDIGPLIAFLAQKDLLTPSVIVRAASRGDMRVVEAILAHLSGYSRVRVKEMMSGGSFGALFRKSGLPRVCHGILNAACEVNTDMQEEGLDIDAEAFGRRLLESLMSRYETMPALEREKQIDYLGRFAEGRARSIARRLKADLLRAAA